MDYVSRSSPPQGKPLTKASCPSYFLIFSQGILHILPLLDPFHASGSQRWLSSSHSQLCFSAITFILLGLHCAATRLLGMADFLFFHYPNFHMESRTQRLFAFHFPITESNQHPLLPRFQLEQEVGRHWQDGLVTLLPLTPSLPPTYHTPKTGRGRGLVSFSCPLRYFLFFTEKAFVLPCILE